MSEAENKTIEVQIYGKTYPLKSSESVEYVKKMAAYVDNIMQDIGKGGLSDTFCAVTAALIISDEFQKLKDKCEKQNEEINTLSELLYDKLDDVLKSEE